MALGNPDEQNMLFFIYSTLISTIRTFEISINALREYLNNISIGSCGFKEKNKQYCQPGVRHSVVTKPVRLEKKDLSHVTALQWQFLYRIHVSLALHRCEYCCVLSSVSEAGDSRLSVWEDQF